MKTLYYNIGTCFTFMNFPIRAIEYFEKLQANELEAYVIEYGFNIQRHLAVNFSKTGRIQKALKKLESCIAYAESKENFDKLSLGAVYLDRGNVYLDAGNFEKALENFEIASNCFDKKSESYLVYMCHKAILLRLYNKDDEVTELVNNGLSMATKGTLWYEWLDAIKHSMALDNQESLMYFEYTIIPKLLEYGKHLLVMNCYEWISNHYGEKRCYKQALEYTNKAKKTYKKLMEGDLSL